MGAKPRVGKVRFLAKKDTIEKEMEEGWPLSYIHDKYSSDLDMSYPQFVKYVHRYITHKHSNNHLASASAPPTGSALDKKSLSREKKDGVASHTSPEAKKPFEYDPTYANRHKDDLI